MGFLSGLFGGGSKNNPANAAMPYLNQIAPMAKENLGPWANQGQTAQTQNAGQYSNLIENPADFYESLRSTYKPSEGYNVRRENALKAAQGAAAAGGYAATPHNQAAQAKLVNDLMAQDEGDYIDRLLGLYGTGLQGNEAIANRGSAAASDLTNVIGSTLGSQGTLAYEGQKDQNATRMAGIRQLLQLLGGAGGAFLGGPVGGALGANIMGGSVGYPSNQQMAGAGLGRGR